MKAALDKWLFSYLLFLMRDRSINKKEPVEIMFCLVDHFEPAWNKADINVQRKRVDFWEREYPLMSEKYTDSDGVSPQHTWFFPPHEEDEHLKRLVGLCRKRYGEIELHLHHDHIMPVPDTSMTLEKKINDAIQRYSDLGVFGINKRTGKHNYGFIHGDWALDNSRGGKFCGVNDEISILSRTGCYADFTFPSICESQPQKINSIYYATDDPDRPKSYNTGVDVEAGHQRKGDLMLVQGPLGVRWKSKCKIPWPAIEASNISLADIPIKKRVDFWVKTGIKVVGCNNWIFIKVHTHGAADKNFNVVLGEAAKSMYQYLETKYNDGKKFRLHYVTTRELYNIVKAAEAGEKGDPCDYRDYIIERPQYQI